MAEPTPPTEPPRSQSGLLRWAQSALSQSPPAAAPRPDDVGPFPRPITDTEAERADAAEALRESERRMALIVAYMKDPTSDPAFADKALMFSVLTDERVYQADQASRLKAALGSLPPPAQAMGLTAAEADALPEYQGLEARRAVLEQAQRTAASRQAQLFMLMKRLTGTTGATGGTGILAAPPPAAPPPITADVDDVLGDMFGP